MAKIDISSWKEFRVGEYFHGVRGTSRKLQGLEDGATPIIAAARYNQGIAGYYNIPSEYENSITISCNGVGCGSTYYHDYPFAITGDAIVLQNTVEIPDRALHFIASVYDTYFSRKYSYNDKCSAEKAEAELIKLPATPSGEPDWTYMDEYMQSVIQLSKEYLNNLRKCSAEKTTVDISKWKEYKIEDLFDIKKGSRLTKAKMKQGSIRYIGASAMNNGLTTSIGNDEKLHPANTITVCYNGSVGETFYQDKPFWASDDVNVLYPKFDMNINIGMFICPLICSVGKRYVFIDKWRMDVMGKDIIKLPVDNNGNPDWTYMDNYMAKVMDESKKMLEQLAI